MTGGKEDGELLKGYFYDSPVQGLEYESQTVSGLTGKNGEFEYRNGETVTFSVGGLVLGASPGKELITPADLVVETGGDIRRLKNQKVANIARFLQSINRDVDIEEGIIVTDQIRETVRRHRYDIDFDQSEEAFTESVCVKALFADLSASLRTSAQARNHLRRTMSGIRKTTDVKIPMRDGAYLLADIFRPLKEGKYPVVMSLGVFGKAFQSGCICSENDLLEKEEAEDTYFQGSPEKTGFGSGPVPWENHETANSADWVPRGYAVIRIDGRGVGKTPGREEMFSLQEARDLYDSIEWAAGQPWSNGRVGLWGTGYYGMNAYNLAQFRPPGLKAFIPISADSDSYRDYIFTGGGLFNTFSRVVQNSCGEWEGVDWVSIAKENPFDEPEIYGPEGSICISPDLEKIEVPFWSAMGLSGTIHTRGTSEAYFRSSSTHKKMTIISETGIHYWAYATEFLEKHIAFFDHWLKGIDNGIMDGPPIDIMVRTGWGGYYWQQENEWPLSRTRYTRYYLDAAPAGWESGGMRHDYMRLLDAVPGEERSSEYAAGVEWSLENAWMHGIFFITAPVPEDLLLAGYLKLVAWVSSTTHDMELHVSVRVLDENGREVPYPLGIFDRTTGKDFPVGFGALKVSHRKLDLQKSTVFRPYHTHRKADYQPLVPGVPVEAEVEIWPTTALVKRGWRIRLDVQPASGSGIGLRIYDVIDQTYQPGSRNTIYTGPEHPSYLQLPVIPPK